MIEIRYMLIAVACVLILLISLITMKYRKLLRTRAIEMSREDVVGRLFLRKIRKLGESAGKDEPGELFRKLNTIMRNFFSELYEIAYEFAYVELNEELVKKGIEEDIRNTIIDYTMQMAQSEYSGQKMREQEFYYLLGKSVKIIEKVTGHDEEEPTGSKQAEEKLKEHAVPSEKPAGKEEVQSGKEPAQKGPEPEKPGKKPEVPHKEEPGKGMSITKEDKGKVDKLRRLLVSAEMNISEKKPREAMDSYIDLRVIYDSLAPGLKVKMNPEAMRIIAIYNTLLKEYKDVLAGKK